MTTCYLVRHGEAAPGAEDRLRPLTERGREDVRRVAQYAAALAVRVAEIRHSGLVRARETAEILADHLASQPDVRPAEGLAPDDEPATAQVMLESAGAPLMLVGHLPHLGRLASALAVGSAAPEIVRFQPATVVCLARGGDGWLIQWILTPTLVSAGTGGSVLREGPGERST